MKRDAETATFVLRDQCPADFETLWRIDQECFPPGIAYPREELAYYLGQKNAFALVAEQGGVIAGFVVGEVLRRGAGHIITLDVREAARRAGLGSRLMRAAEERLCSAGCHMVFLETAVDNLAALTFYKRHGYSVLRTLPRYYQGSVDGLRMEKRLV
ncbi:MAG TPA: GNAT family N-acetyltransferase [Terriglobales bacterium]|nr:GNAT family N-acetyltransferase [Terriglobales bacterium]